MKQLLLVFVLSLPLIAQDAKVAPKPSPPSVTCAATQAASPEGKCVDPPAINTSKLWRIVAEGANARNQVTAQTKLASESDAAASEEQQALAGQCGALFVLVIDQNPKSATYKDAICAPRAPNPGLDSKAK